MKCCGLPVAVLTALSCFWAIPRAGAAESVPAGYTAGTPWIGAAGVRQRTADIMAREAEHARRGKQPYRIHYQGEVELVQHAEGGVHTPSPAGVSGPIPASTANAQGVAFSFTGATLADTHAYPPDSMGAVGPRQFIVAVNGRVRSFDKTTGLADGVIDADTDVFFSSVMTPTSVNFTSDPRIRYDRLSRRWFIIMIDVPNGTGTSPDRIMIAVSDGPVITSSSSWTFYYFQHDGFDGNDDNGKFADYPTLGIDANALYIGVNVFKTRGQGRFDNTTAFVVRKSSLLNGGPIVVTAFRSLVGNGKNVGPYTPQGVDNYDPGATEGYIIGVGATGAFLYFDQLILRRISDPGGTPAISGNIAITIPSDGSTINVPHLGNTGGTAGYLDGLDYRLLAAHFRDGRLWTSQNIGVDNTGSPSGTDTRMGVRWYELQGIATGQTPGVFQSGTVFQSSPGNTSDQRCYWMGTIMVSGQGHAAMGFSVAGANEHANAGTVGRLANDPPGTMRTPILYTASSTAYNPRDSNNNPINRWGDYSYTCLDPDDDMTMWTIQEFCNAADSYGVEVARLLAPLPATPAACNPSVLTQGVANVSVVLTGVTDGDTGFFDPGAGFSNRIAAAVSGTGVTVNSVLYSNPTNLTLNLSVAGAAATGARTITVINPDGQSAASESGILTIAPAALVNHAPILAAITNRTMFEQTLLSFTVEATDSDAGQILTFSLDAGAPTNAMINPTNGLFTWTPDESQGPGTNAISVIVADNGTPSLSATQTFTVTVLESNSPPVLTPLPDRSVYAGTTLTLTNRATDPDIPANILTFSLDTNAPPGATLDSVNGVFSWTPDLADANTSHAFTVRVTDNGVPPLFDEKTFNVLVLAGPVIRSIDISSNEVTVTWTAIASRTYQLQFSTNLLQTNWSDVPPEITAIGSSATNTDVFAPDAPRYYRVMVVP